MTTVRNIYSLNMLKMEKNFIAHNDKGYTRYPHREYGIPDLFGFVKREFNELEDSYLDYMDKGDDDLEREKIISMMNEVADISNTLDYLYERLLRYLRC